MNIRPLHLELNQVIFYVQFSRYYLNER